VLGKEAGQERMRFGSAKWDPTTHASDTRPTELSLAHQRGAAPRRRTAPREQPRRM